MYCLKICVFLTFLMLIKVGAEVVGKDESNEMLRASATTLPIALHLSNSIQVVEHEILQATMDKSNEQLRNDIEVFKENLGPQMEKQDEIPEAEAEGEEVPAEADAEEVKPEEEAEPEAEPPAEAEVEEVAEPEAEAPAEEEIKPDEPKEGEKVPTVSEAEEDIVKDLAPEPELEPEAEPAVEEEKEDTPPEAQPQSEESANTDEAAVANDDSEMPNDEPAKDEEHDKKDVENVAEDAKTKTTAAKDHVEPEVSCFTCTSVEDTKCHMNATHQVPCPKVNEGDAGKHNGCYTLYQADTNTTMRGCVDELVEEGLKYCLTNEKLCNLCYKNGCNNEVAPSHANMQQFNLYSMLFLNMFFIITIKKLTNVSLI